MDKVAYNEGYEAAKKAIAEALKNGNSGGGGNSGPQDPNLDTDMGNGQQANPNGASQDQGQGQGKGTPGGSRGTGAGRKARNGEVTQMGGSFIDKAVGEQIAKESGYDDNEQGVDEDVEKKWEKIGRQVAQGIGSGRGGRLGQLLDQIYKPTKNWKAELKMFIGHAIGGLNTSTAWGRKGFLQYDEIRRFDKVNSECLDKVVFMVDTSGSNIGALELILGECVGIVKAKKIPEITFAWYDYGCKDAIETISTNGRLDIKNKVKKASGGGGTSFARAIVDVSEYLKKKHKNKVDLLMIFTDGDTCDEVKTKPTWAKNAMFVISDRPSCPKQEWGKTIYINSEDVKR